MAALCISVSDGFRVAWLRGVFALPAWSAARRFGLRAWMERLAACCEVTGSDDSWSGHARWCRDCVWKVPTGRRPAGRKVGYVNETNDCQPSC